MPVVISRESFVAGVRDESKSQNARMDPVVPEAADTRAQCVIVAPVLAVNGPKVRVPVLEVSGTFDPFKVGDAHVTV